MKSIPYIKSDIRKLTKEIGKCHRVKDRELRTYLIARKTVLKEVLSMLEKEWIPFKKSGTTPSSDFITLQNKAE
tara:strand:- start:1160 stop:1381 length:222 start_codon:yes stop_codon:yes gene_type:complete